MTSSIITHPIRDFKLLALVGALALAGCAGAQAPMPESPFQAVSNDRSCAIAAGNKLRQLLALDGTNPRVTPASDIGGPAGARIVEIDAASAGLPVTYLFLCVIYDTGTIVEPMGHR